MRAYEILNHVELAAGSNAKLEILQKHKSNMLLKKILQYGLDSFMQFNIVKVPETNNRLPLGSDEKEWELFFKVADSCHKRDFTGNKAISEMENVFLLVDSESEKWMRKILQKNFKFGANLKTIEKVFPGIVKTFEIQLAEKWNEKSFENLPPKIRVEPKLDGIRLVAVVKDGHCEIFSRAGKSITNFDQTVGAELVTLPSGVYDGEVMDKDFISLMRQVHKDGSTADVSSSYFALFDFIPLDEWETRKSAMALRDRREQLEKNLAGKSFQYLKLVEYHETDRNVDAVKSYHKICVYQGYEGAMIKNPALPYCFGRSDAVIKFKEMHDDDFKVVGFKEGTGRLQGKLGALIVDTGNGTCEVGTGFSDVQREEIWENRSKFLGMTVTVQYQERTEKDSLRFPVFMHWRLDK